MGGFGYWMGAKYAALAKHADAAYLSAQAQMLAAQSGAQVDPARAEDLYSQSYKTRQEGGMVKPAAQAGIRQTEAGSAEQEQKTGWFDAHPNENPAGYALPPGYQPAQPRQPTAPYTGATSAPSAGYMPGIGGSVTLSPGAEARPATPPPVSYAGPGMGVPALGGGNSFTSGPGPGLAAYGGGNPLQHFAEGTPDVQPNFGAWGGVGTSAPVVAGPAPAPSTFQNTGKGMIAAPQLTAPTENQIPVPQGARAMAAPASTGAPVEHDAWGLSTPLGHSRTTGVQGDWGEYKSPAVVSSVDGRRPQVVQPAGKYGWEDPYAKIDMGYGKRDYAKGTSKVPAGKGHAPAKSGKGMVDAKVAPGEAVLTPGAADHMGRDNIGMLNAMAHHGALSSQKGPGANPQSIGMVQGMPPPSPQALQIAAMMHAAAGGGGGPQPPAGPPQGGPPGFAEGTSDIPQKSLNAAGDNGVKMGKEPVLPGLKYATQGYAKGSSNVQQQPDNIGQQVKLGKGKEKAPPDLNLAKGTSKVPGKPTHPSKDTQPAELPPGGAVLTNDAANHVGRGLIAHLNQIHGGMPRPGFSQGVSDIDPSQQGYAEGTPDVETNGQHLMGQLGQAWNYMTTPPPPNPNPYLDWSVGSMAQGAKDLYNQSRAVGSNAYQGYNNLLNALTPLR